MKLYPVALIALLMLGAGCAQQPIYDGNNVIVRSDMGGKMAERETEIASFRYTGQRVVIDGPCASACTMYLGLDNTCLTPHAELLFHGPRSTNAAKGWDGQTFDRMSEQVAKYYPDEIAAWFMSEGRHVNPGIAKMTAEKAISMGARVCDAL